MPRLAEGGQMTLVSEKMYVGATSKKAKSKKIQTVSEEIGTFADKTLEIQQGEGKALLQARWQQRLTGRQQGPVLRRNDHQWHDGGEERTEGA